MFFFFLKSGVHAQILLNCFSVILYFVTFLYSNHETLYDRHLISFLSIHSVSYVCTLDDSHSSSPPNIPSFHEPFCERIMCCMARTCQKSGRERLHHYHDQILKIKSVSGAINLVMWNFILYVVNTIGLL